MRWAALFLCMMVPLWLGAQAAAPPRQLSGQDWETLKSHRDFWYGREAWKEEAPVQVVTRSSTPGFWNNLLLVLLIMGALALIWYTIQRAGWLGTRGGRIRKGSGDTVLEEADVSRDYPLLIREAVALGDYRSALRLHYLQLLSALAGAGHIRWDEGRTDRAYAADLEGTPYAADWKRLSRIYAWSWYGRHPLPEPLYAEWAPQFDQLLGRIGP